MNATHLLEMITGPNPKPSYDNAETYAETSKHNSHQMLTT